MAEELVTNVENTAEEQREKATTDSIDNERLEKLIQSRVDRLLADERKKNVGLQKQLEKLTKEKLSDDELKQLEITEKEKAIAEREKAILDRENRWHAMKAIKEIGLDDGSEKALELIDFVMAEDAKAINEKVKKFNEFVRYFAKSDLEKTYKINGRIPNGANQKSAENKTSIAEKLGKSRAEQQKKSNDILQHYLGGK